MKVAVPVFEGGISPVFDWAQCLLVVDHSGENEETRREESLVDLAPSFRPGRLVQLGVETLLCGGVSAPVAAMLESQGIRVMPGISGDVDAVLEAFFAGGLPDPAFAMPGWRGCGKGMQGRHRCRRGRGGGGRGRRG